LFFIDIPNAAQSSIYVFHMGPQRTDPAFFANQMMALILGGGFSSRVNMNLREDQGYSYGARASFGYSRRYGTFSASSSVRADSTRQSVIEILKEMRGFDTGDAAATAAELEREKNGAILGLPSRFATSSATLTSYTDLVYYGLPLDYYATYAQSVDAVSLEQVWESGKARINVADAIILVVGDAGSPQVTRDDGGKDIPLLDSSGSPIPLRQALGELVASGELGAGGMVVLDPDAKVMK
jgi:zinc protease